LDTETAAITSTTVLPRASRRATSVRDRETSDSPPRIALFLRWARLTDLVVALTALIGAFLITNVGRMPDGFGDFLAMRLTVKNVVMLLAFAAAWRLVCTGAGLYRWEVVKHPRSEARRVLLAAIAGSSAALVFPTISVTGAFRLTTVAVSLAATVAAMLLARAALRNLVDTEADERHAFLIVGIGPRGRELGRRLASSSSARVVGYVDLAEPPAGPDAPGPYLGNLPDLERILLAHTVDEVYVALPMRSRYGEIESALQACERTGVPVKWLADVFESSRGHDRVEASANGRVVSISGEQAHGLLVVKRLIDVVGSTIGLIVLTPVVAVAAVAIKATKLLNLLIGDHREPPCQGALDLVHLLADREF